jgi:hypothetical protein
MNLRALGFCGADDSIHPNQLAILSSVYPFIEWGVLFRPDKEGTPRYASPCWVDDLAVVAKKYNAATTTISSSSSNSNNKTVPIKLAAHLCERRVNEVLDGDSSFVEKLQEWGFRRVQVNATAVNGVDTSRLGDSIKSFLRIVQKFPQLEFILQKNEETRPLWEGILNLDDETLNSGRIGFLPPNVSMLLDESKGTGVLSDNWPTPPVEYEIGYAGGIGPDNITDVLQKVHSAAGTRSVWIDMESRLRSTKDGTDIFDLDKCYKVIHAVCEHDAQVGHRHPDFLP